MPKELNFDEAKETAKDRKAREEREAREAIVEGRKKLSTLSLVDLIGELSPELSGWSLEWLLPWIHMWERVARGETVMGMCAIPIQSGKTETTLHGIVYTLLRNPTWRIIVFTYNFDRAKKIGKRLRDLARGAGVGPTPGYDEIKQWHNEFGGSVTIMSADQSGIGEPCEVLVCDDPVNENAREQRVRDEVDDAITRYTARARVRGPDGVMRQGSILLVMSRWHPDDPYGRRASRHAETWEQVTCAALREREDGSLYSFAEGPWPLALLLAKREAYREKDPGLGEWEAQFQNNPFLVIDRRFKPDPLRYSVLPPHAYRLVYGVDLAYTAGEGSDFFAIVAVKIMAFKAYILEMQRHKIMLDQIESTCRVMSRKWGQGPIFSYVSGPEVGVVRELRRRGLMFVPLHARWNKLVRAEPTIKRWNDDQVVWPDGPACVWADPAIVRFTMFTGEQKARGDDEIDALVSALDGGLGSVASGQVKTIGKSYAGMGIR